MEWEELQFYYRFDNNYYDSSLYNRQLQGEADFILSTAMDYVGEVLWLQNSEVNEDGVVLNWLDCENAQEYFLSVATDDNFENLLVDKYSLGTSLQHTYLTDFADGQPRFFKLEAVNDKQRVTTSDIKAVIFPEVPVLNLNFSLEGGTLSWSAEHECNVVEFIVEKRIGETWTEIATVEKGDAYVVEAELADEYRLVVVDSYGDRHQYSLTDMEIEYDLRIGWNLISAPFDVDLSDYDKVFWVWDAENGHYVRSKSVKSQQGIWLCSQRTERINLQGKVQENEACQLSLGRWNLLGPMKTGATVEGVTTFAWTGNYYEHTDSLEVGKGYWVFTQNELSACELTK